MGSNYVEKNRVSMKFSTTMTSNNICSSTLWGARGMFLYLKDSPSMIRKDSYLFSNSYSWSHRIPSQFLSQLWADQSHSCKHGREEAGQESRWLFIGAEAAAAKEAVRLGVGLVGVKWFWLWWRNPRKRSNLLTQQVWLVVIPSGITSQTLCV